MATKITAEQVKQTLDSLTKSHGKDNHEVFFDLPHIVHEANRIFKKEEVSTYIDLWGFGVLDRIEIYLAKYVAEGKVSRVQIYHNHLAYRSILNE